MFLFIFHAFLIQDWKKRTSALSLTKEEERKIVWEEEMNEWVWDSRDEMRDFKREFLSQKCTHHLTLFSV